MQPSAAPTFGQCADEYIQTHEATWRNDKHRAGSRCKRPTPQRSAIYREVDTEAVLRVLTPLWTRAPETASRLRGRIEAVLASARVLSPMQRSLDDEGAL